MLRKSLIVALLLIPLPAFGSTQWPRECRGDIARVCRSVMQEADQAILKCLQSSEPKLSRGCRKLLQSYGHLAK